MHTRRRHACTLITLMLAAAIVACADMAGVGGAGRDEPGQAITSGRSDSGTSEPDTGRQKPDSGKPVPDTGAPPPDTASRPDTGGQDPDTGRVPVDTGARHEPDTTITDGFIRGDVYGIDSSRVPAVIRPLGGVAVTAFRQVRRPGGGTDSAGVQWDSVGTRGTNAQGAFEFTDLRGGFYRLRAVPPAETGFSTAEVRAVAWSNSALVLVAPTRIYLHRRR